MKNLTYRPFIASARVLSPDEQGSASDVLGVISFADLCALANVKLRVTEAPREIVCVRGEQSFLIENRRLVGGAMKWPLTRTDALRVLETLAHGLHDYAARECICGRKMFSAPARRGRPAEGVRAKTPRERVAEMRARRRAAVQI